MAIAFKGLIFDYGNVLCAPQPREEVAAMATVLNLSEAEFAPHYWRHRHDYDAARLDAQGYWRLVASEAGRVVNDSAVAQLTELDVRSWTHPSLPMVECARQIRQAGLRTAVLSNMPLVLRESLASLTWMPEFDHATYSCDLGVCKPDAAIYLSCLEGLGIAAEDSLFLDDRPENVAAAQELGIKAVVFTAEMAQSDGEAFLRSLPALLGVD